MEQSSSEKQLRIRKQFDLLYYKYVNVQSAHFQYQTYYYQSLQMCIYLEPAGMGRS